MISNTQQQVTEAYRNNPFWDKRYEARIKELEDMLKDAYKFVPNGLRDSMTDEPLGRWEKIL